MKPFHFLHPLSALGALPMLLATNPAVALPGDKTEKHDAVQHELRNLKSLHVKFVSTTLHTPYYSDVKEVGEVFLERPNHVRIVVDRYRKLHGPREWNPMGNGSVVVSDGETVTTLTTHPDAAQYKTGKLFSSETLIAQIEPLSGFFEEKGETTESAKGTRKSLGKRDWKGTSYRVTETTEAGKNGEVRRELYRDSAGWIKRVISYSTEKGKPVVRETVLTEIEADAPVAPERFTLTIPANATPVKKRATTPAIEVGAIAPDFTVTDAQGKPVRLSELRGKPVLLKFFATWCGTCRLSLPQTEHLAKKYAGQVTVLAVTTWDSAVAFKKWNEKGQFGGIRFTLDPAPQGDDIASTRFGMPSIPAEYVLDKDGKVVATFSGYEGDKPELEESLLKALK